jgi:hypothetical protein
MGVASTEELRPTFQELAESGEARVVRWEATWDSSHIRDIVSRGRFDFESPGRAYLAYKSGSDGVGFIDFEYLLADGRFYFNDPGDGWFSAAVDEPFHQGHETYEVMADAAPFDYVLFVDSLYPELLDFGIEEVNGVAFRHVQAAASLTDLKDSGVTVPTGEGHRLDGGDTPIDIWLEADSGRLHRLVLEATGTASDSNVDISVDYVFEYPETAEVAEPPEISLPLADWLEITTSD